MRVEDHYIGADNCGRQYYQLDDDYYTYTPHTGGQTWHWITSRNLLANRNSTLEDHLQGFGTTFIKTV